MTSPIRAGGPTVDLDHAATTRLRPEAAAAMAPFLGDRYGNPSGAHALGRDAVRALDEARELVAGLLGCRPDEVVFTSGGTESDNHAVTGGLPPRPGTPVCSAVEHHAVLDATLALGGVTVAVDDRGRVDLDDLARVLDGTPEVSVVSVMAVNNEVGSVNDLTGVAEVVRRHAPGTPLHTDAVQAPTWLPLAAALAPVDLASLSGHKFGGPRGAGVLMVRRGTSLRPLLRGGGQERGLRSGTPDVAGAVGLATALALAAAEREDVVARTGRLRDRLADALVSAVPGATETVVRGGDRSHVAAGFCHLCIPEVDAEALLLLLDQGGVCASAGSACSSGALEGSHVLAALGVGGGPDAPAPLRLTLGPDTTDADVDRVLDVLPRAVERIRTFRPDRAGD